MIIEQVTIHHFHERFLDIRPDNFSYEGRIELFDYLENLSNEQGETIELDVIAICCEYTEYKSLAEFQKDYGEEYEDMSDIERSTTVLDIDGEAFIIAQF